MASPQDRAWSEGHKAGKHGEPISACPYGSGMMQQSWQVGWRAGQAARDAKGS
ncbi:ribosome modulation factor [Sphingomonas sp. RB56-2]|uniref:Ribosome modulation factor n=1 Tax=Sphingomonas brevis TaxID=2908206 RepID=A0ABT0SBB6_9SPHN|nr:ribosome modulation factor [Sphingomonas brevis]MCL6741709.1 ribosome modulation factor [Sphingomonas brevis]